MHKLLVIPLFLCSQMAAKVRKISKKAQVKKNRDARKGEADRHIFDMKPKHLFAGKRKMEKQIDDKQNTFNKLLCFCFVWTSVECWVWEWMSTLKFEE